MYYYRLLDNKLTTQLYEYLCGCFCTIYYISFCDMANTLFFAILKRLPMKRYYVKKTSSPRKKPSKRFVVSAGSVLTILGCGMMAYFALPVFAWEAFYKSTFASVIAPIPDYSPAAIAPEEAGSSFSVLSAKETAVESDNTWFPKGTASKDYRPAVPLYTLSIPRIGILDAEVSTVDSDLSQHLVQYWGTPVPPATGNTVLFGHSTLPHLFNRSDYTTIFANAHDLVENDLITVTVKNRIYTYKIYSIFITTPADLSVLDQNTDEKIITIVTCTPPGTTWKRLIIKARMING